MLRQGSDGHWALDRVALDDLEHRAYPHVLASDDGLLVTPDSGRSGGVDIFLDRGPVVGLARVGHALEGIPASDPTLLWQDGHYWLFVTVTGQGMSPWDELHLYRASSVAGPWLPHPQNPVVADVRCARPAGRIFRHADQFDPTRSGLLGRIRTSYRPQRDLGPDADRLQGVSDGHHRTARDARRGADAYVHLRRIDRGAGWLSALPAERGSKRVDPMSRRRPTRGGSYGARLSLAALLVLLVGWAGAGPISAVAVRTEAEGGRRYDLASSASPGTSSASGPVISGVATFDVTQTSVQITWTLSEPSTGQVEYGLTPAYGSVTTPEMSFDYTTHIQDIDNLHPGTTYHFRVRSSNEAGFESVSQDGTFTTLSSPSPIPIASGAPGYAAIFTGDATGVTDVTDALRTFLQSHNGERVALAENGIYKVSQLSFTASDLTVDFRGSRLQASVPGVAGILQVQTSNNVVLNDPTVYGTGYVWDGVSENEHGIQIYGGTDIVINHPVTRDTRGDGIYTNYGAGDNEPPTGVVITDPDIERAARNGIAPVAGEVTIRGGHIAYTGLHGIDFEVNDDIAAASIRGVVDGVDIRHHGDIPGIESSTYAVAAGGYSKATKPSVTVENLTGDVLRITIRNTEHVTVINNVSDESTTADFPGSKSVTFKDNVRIARHR